MQTKYSPSQNKSPLLYWATLAYIVGIPNFVHFDVTGRTPDPFSITAILVLAQTAFSAYLLVVLLALDKRPIFFRRVNYAPWLWIGLFLQFIFTSLLQPDSRVNPIQNVDLFYAFYTMAQWVIAFLSVLVLYSRESPERGSEFIVKMIGRTSWIWIAIVWIVLPIMPAQAFGGADESSGNAMQLGGELIHPVRLAAMAAIAFFYAVLFFPRGPKKWLGCAVALITLALTSARTGEVGFLLTLLMYTLFLSGKPILRWGTVFLAIPGALMGVALGDKLEKYISRGQSLQTLESLNDRTRIWSASWEAIKLRPIIGYGYIYGAKKALRDHWTFAHWIPPHPHNELLGTLLDGGVIALGFSLAIYGLVFWRAMQNVRRNVVNMFLMIVFLQVLVTCISGPIFSYKYTVLGGIAILCFIGILAKESGRPKQFKHVSNVNTVREYEMQA